MNRVNCMNLDACYDATIAPVRTFPTFCDSNFLLPHSTFVQTSAPLSLSSMSATCRDLLERRARAAAATATKMHAWETYVASCRADARLRQRSVMEPQPAVRPLLSSSSNGPAMMFSAFSLSRELTGTRSAEPLSAADQSSTGVSLNTPMHQYPTSSTVSGTCTRVSGTAAAQRDGGYGGLPWKDEGMSLIMEHEDAMSEHHLNFTTTSDAMEDGTNQRTVHVPPSSEREDELLTDLELLAGFRPGGLSEFPLQALSRRQARRY